MSNAENRDDVTVETAMEEAQFPVDNGEALFPSVEEVRASNAGMSPGGSRRNIWRGSSSSPTRGTTQTKKKNPWLLTLLIALPLIVLLIIVPAVVVSQNNKEEEQAAAIPPPTYEELVNFLVVNQISLNSTFAYSDSPQSKAARWLAEEDGARLSLPEPNFRIYDSYMYMFRYVMAVNYYALNGPEWKKQLNFLSDADVCEWNDVAVVGDVVTRLGVLCQWVITDDGDRLYVPFLLYLLIQLEGEIPAENGKLHTLWNFRMQLSEGLTGTIPSELCGLSNLTSLALSHNSLTGEIPTCLGELPYLQDLLLSQNFLDGSIPTELANLGNSLRLLYIDDNVLTGDPTNVFNALTNVVRLYVNDNEFEATLDSSFLSEVSTLNWADFSSNKFAGSFPSHLFRHDKLNVLDFTNNELTGEFGEIERNTFFQLLSVHNNEMSGNLSSLSNLAGLIHLDVSNNQFTGSMETVTKFPEMLNLFLSNNPFELGPIPELLFNLTDLEEVSIRNTNRNGELLDSIGKLSELILLDLGSNLFNSTIPESYGELSNLEFFLLNNNTGITGDLPSSFTNMTQLRGVFLDGTSINGDEAVELLCVLPNFEDNITDSEVVIIDCEGECDVCNGCQCCDPNNGYGCSDPLLGNYDASWLLGFARSKYDDYDLRNENATYNDGDRAMRF